MAMADYYLCDVCGGKCFYDSNLNYERDPDTDELKLDYVGQMAAICDECVKTHRIVIVARESQEAPHTPQEAEARQQERSAHAATLSTLTEALKRSREAFIALTPGHRTHYDWNADPMSLTRVVGDAMLDIDRALATHRHQLSDWIPHA